jgi:hypothetical protein
MTRPLSDLVPLRDTSAWQGYDEIAIIPRVYGRARIKPLRYNEAGTLYVVADHVIASVDAVAIDGEAIAYRWRNGADTAGHAVAFLELAEAPDSSASIAAEVRGLSGNPADILQDIYPRADLQDFAVYCRNAALELGGALAERMTLRAAIDFVTRQVGAAWSAGLPGFAAPFPPDSDGPIWASLCRLDIVDWSAECALDAIVTRLTVPFDYDYAAGKARQSVVLEAPAALREHGARESEFALPWVRSARQAIATATSWLQWRARPLWKLRLSVGVDFRGIQPGGWIVVDHPRLPQVGAYAVTDIDPAYGRGSVTIVAETPAGLKPAVQTTLKSSAFDPITTEYSLDAGGDTVAVTITDETGQPLPGAKVWVDGQGPITADASAKVRFKATPGRHVLRIEADGRSAVNTEITL